MMKSGGRILLCRILLVLNLALIWGNSLLSGAESSQMSSGIMAFVMELLRIHSDHSDGSFLFSFL